MFRFINLYALKKFCRDCQSTGKNVYHNGFNVDEIKLEGLVGYIEEDRKRSGVNQRYANMWYDFLCSCSTRQGRAELDITALMVQFEGMLYYLLNGEFNDSSIIRPSTISYDDVCNLIGYVNNVPEYSMPPLDVKFKSDLFYTIIALQMPSALKKVSNLVQDGHYNNEMEAVIEDLKKKEQYNNNLWIDVEVKLARLMVFDPENQKIHKEVLKGDIWKINHKMDLLRAIVSNRKIESDKSLKQRIIEVFNRRIKECGAFYFDCKNDLGKGTVDRGLLIAQIKAADGFLKLLSYTMDFYKTEKDPIGKVYGLIKSGGDAELLYEVLDVLKDIIRNDIKDVEKSLNKLNQILVDRKEELRAYEDVRYRLNYISKQHSIISGCKRYQEWNEAIRNFLENKNEGWWKYESLEGFDKGEQFSKLLNIVCMYIAKCKNVELQCVGSTLDDVKSGVVEIRNEASHKGYVNDDGEKIYIENKRIYVYKDKIINFILLIASELTPSTSNRKNRNVLEGVEALHAGVLSGKILGSINVAIEKVKNIVEHMGAKRWLIGVLVLLLVVLGYYRYKNSDVPISYINVPKVKRIELYDRIINNTLTEDYVKRMQSDVQRFEVIKKEVEDE